MCLFDMHCHLDFANNYEQIAEESTSFGITALSSTVMPTSYVSDLEKFNDYENIFIGLGIHPWWIANHRVSEVDFARFEDLIVDAHFVGEIGLDFSAKYKPSKTLQEASFVRIVQAIKASGDNKVITLHGVHSATALMDILYSYNIFSNNTCLFHSFNGSAEEFGRALATGAFFSVGKRMLASEKGAQFAAAIPDNQLVLETDNPPHEGTNWSAALWHAEIQSTLQALAGVRGADMEDMRVLVAHNAEAILK